jgi:hypothetical protein
MPRIFDNIDRELLPALRASLEVGRRADFCVGYFTSPWNLPSAPGCAPLDGLVAHLYGLTEEEFVHILATFPLVPDPVRVAARNAYRDVERELLQ